jgi:hypothetical protein
MRAHGDRERSSVQTGDGGEVAEALSCLRDTLQQERFFCSELVKALEEVTP